MEEKTHFTEKKEEEKDSKQSNGIFLWGFLIDWIIAMIYLLICYASVQGEKAAFKQILKTLPIFLICYYVQSCWIAQFIRNIQRGKFFPIEIFLMIPWFIGPFFCIYPFFPPKVIAGSIFLLIPSELIIFSIGYLLQERKQDTICTRRVSAIVVDNKKVIMKHATNPRQGHIPTYHPILEYWADGQMRHCICDDGQPRPFEIGSTVDILYNPENVEEFQFANPKVDRTRFWGPIFFLILSMLFIGAGIAILL